MKFAARFVGVNKTSSLPVRGAWVEIAESGTIKAERKASLPVRGAWVEINALGEMMENYKVAPRAGSVG